MMKLTGSTKAQGLRAEEPSSNPARVLSEIAAALDLSEFGDHVVPGVPTAPDAMIVGIGGERGTIDAAVLPLTTVASITHRMVQENEAFLAAMSARNDRIERRDQDNREIVESLLGTNH